MDIADQYLAESAQLLAAALAIGETAPAVETNASIRLSDPRLTPFIEDLKYYSHRTRELERTMRLMGKSERGLLRALSQIDVYRGIVLGKYRRFSEARVLFEEARARSPFPIEQEPNPLPGESESRLGDLTRFAEQWHTRLGRLDVNVNAAYLAIRNLPSKTLRFEQVRFTREAPVPPATSSHEQAMHDSLVALAEHILNDNIANRQQEFSPHPSQRPLHAQRHAKHGHSHFIPRVRCPHFSTHLTARQPVVAHHQNRVGYGSPANRRRGRTRPRLCNPIKLLLAAKYALLVKMGDYKRHRENIILYPASDIKPVWPGVTAIAATPRYRMPVLQKQATPNWKPPSSATSRANAAACSNTCSSPSSA